MLSYFILSSFFDDTRWNCGGGRTPWNTWVSCEEQPNGNIYQTDPFGEIKAEKLTLGSDGGRFESFTYDISDLSTPHFFVTEGTYPNWTKTTIILKFNTSPVQPFSYFHGFFCIFHSH